MKHIEIYTDGSCIRNPGPGGWAAILKYNDVEKMISGGSPKATNNQMEMQAVISALKQLRYKCEVTVTADSQYVSNAFNKPWVYKWEKENNFRGRPNAELWRELIALTRIHKVEFKWIKGHAGHYYNELCDKEAQRQSRYYDTGEIHNES